MLSEENIGKYALLQIKQAKFELVEFFAKERASLIHASVLITLLALLLIFGSLYVSFLINSYFGSNHLGFGITFLIWVLLFVLAILFKKTIKRSLFENYADQNIPS